MNNPTLNSDSEPSPSLTTPPRFRPPQRPWLITLLSVVGLLATSGTANAALQLSVTSTSFSSGGVGSVFVEIDGNGDAFQSMQVVVQVRPVGAVAGQLQFQPSPASELFADPDYVFYNNSFNEFLAIDPVGILSDHFANDTAHFIDGTFDGQDLVLSGTKTVARLDFLHVLPSGTPSSEADGDQFEFVIDEDQTSFLTASYSFPTFSASPSPGIAMAAATAAVPEPSTACSVCVVLALAAWRRRRSVPPHRNR